MSRSFCEGEIDSEEDLLRYGRWRGQVAAAIRGKRGQAFLRELAAAMDAMPAKELVASELVTPDGDCCAIGVVCKARGLDVSNVDENEHDQVAGLVGIAEQLANEIAWENDEGGLTNETDGDRWIRMRKWVDRQLKPSEALRAAVREAETTSPGEGRQDGG